MESLYRVHTRDHVDDVQMTRFQKYVTKSGEWTLEPKMGKDTHYIGTDVYCNKHSADCALMAAGASVEACDQIFLMYSCDSVFAAIRPPGHHADQNHIQGFCFFNNAAIAAKHLRERLELKKVVIFDWDVHFGDGTSKIFYEDDSVLYISLHRFDDGKFYPGIVGAPVNIGAGKGEGFNINFGFNVPGNDINDLDYIYACSQFLFPLIKEFNPEAIIISCGFDCAAGDQIGRAGVTTLGFSWMTYGLMQICPKIISLLEGGYNLKALALSSEAVLETLFVNND